MMHGQRNIKTSSKYLDQPSTNSSSTVPQKVIGLFR